MLTDEELIMVVKGLIYSSFEMEFGNNNDDTEVAKLIIKIVKESLKKEVKRRIERTFGE
jgi:hypothetical protein